MERCRKDDQKYKRSGPEIIFFTQQVSRSLQM
jgi:hypothetical protein